MRILVSAASRHGSTAETATRIAGSLRAGLPADVVVDALPAAEVGDPTSYDAVVLGSAVYLGRWLDDARRLAERIAAQPPRPVWLFSVGPIGDPPKPDEDPAEVGDIVRARRRVLVDHALAGPSIVEVRCVRLRRHGQVSAMVEAAVIMGSAASPRVVSDVV